MPLPFVTLNTVGPALQVYGSQEQKQFFLPKILAGELHFAIGYSEPSAGTDLANLSTRADRDGDEWIINGQKIFTTGGHDADYVWLAARTDQDAPTHKGITIFTVPTASRPVSRIRRSGCSAAATPTRRSTTGCACRTARSSVRSTADGD